MKIGILDADLMDNGTRHPNLALMKIAGYYRSIGDEVSLIFRDYLEVYSYNKVFVSKVFTFTEIPDWVTALDHVSFGGTGFYLDGGANLPDEIEHHMPYYDLYENYVDQKIAEGHKESRFADYLHYSIGFTTRGCFRKCSFCVNKKYNHTFLHSPVSEFLDTTRPYIYLWDDNILALPEWEQVLDDIEATGKAFQFRQGIDLRLMTDQKAKRFTRAHYQGDFIFAFDHIEDRKLIEEKVQLWKRYSAKICKMYVISGFKSQDEHDIEDVFTRIHVLMQYGSLPYIMRYEAYKTSRYRSIYVELARWCNQPNFFKKMSFRQFCIANQDYKKNQETQCSAMKALSDFEFEHPEIAKRFFDLRFDEESMYLHQYGYGRRYANKPLCKDCIRKKVCWKSILASEVDYGDVIRAYFTKELDIECLQYANAECSVDAMQAAHKIIEIIQATPIQEIIEYISKSNDRETVQKDNIPQLSKSYDAIYKTPQILHDCERNLPYSELGFYLRDGDPDAKMNDIASKKYGENHAKLAALLDLVIIRKTKNSALVELSSFGKAFLELSNEDRRALEAKLHLRIPIIQDYFLEGGASELLETKLSILSDSTKKRRGSDVQSMIQLVLESGGLPLEVI